LNFALPQDPLLREDITTFGELACLLHWEATLNCMSKDLLHWYHCRDTTTILEVISAKDFVAVVCDEVEPTCQTALPNLHHPTNLLLSFHLAPSGTATATLTNRYNSNNSNSDSKC
jgi:hypothetical protein